MTTTALTVSQPQAPAMYSQADYVRWQIVGKDIDKDEFDYFLAVANHLGLDPVRRQIYCVKRAGRAVVQTGIDGYRAIAARSGLLAGIDDAVFDTEDAAHPNWARVTVYRLVRGQRYAFTATARWKEYKPERSPMWERMPYLMLAKCAEALALRKAFPAELSGVYTEEEMMQADNPLPSVQITEQPASQPEAAPQAAQPDNRKYLNPEAQICYRLAGKVGWTVQQVHALVQEHKHKDGSLNWDYVRGVLLKTWAAKYGYQGDAYTTIVEQATGKKVADLAKNTTEGDWQKIEKRIMLIEKGALAEAAKKDGKPAIVVDAEPAQAADEEPEPPEEGYDEQAALTDEASGLHIVK